MISAAVYRLNVLLSYRLTVYRLLSTAYCTCEHGVVPLVEHPRVQEPAALSPGTLALREEPADRLRLEALRLQGLVLVTDLAILQLLVVCGVQCAVCSVQCRAVQGPP